MITEGSLNLVVPDGVFFNVNARVSRDVSVALLTSLGKSNLVVVDLLSASGARGIRFALECPTSSVLLNDGNPVAFEAIKENVKLNNVEGKCQISNLPANRVGGLFDYVDVDPFGSPVDLLDSSVKLLNDNGILAVAATDCAVLSGNKFRCCVERYGSRPLKNELKHEVGLRILIKSIQLAGLKHNVSLVPVFCHWTKHYYRVYLKRQTHNSELQTNHKFLFFCERCLSRFVSESNIEQHCCGVVMSVAGPLWVGSLWDSGLAEKMALSGDKLLSVIASESVVDSFGFFSVSRFASKLCIPMRSPEIIVAELQKLNFKASLSHFGFDCVRTNAPIEIFRKLLTPNSQQFYRLSFLSVSLTCIFSIIIS